MGCFLCVSFTLWCHMYVAVGSEKGTLKFKFVSSLSDQSLMQKSASHWWSADSYWLRDTTVGPECRKRPSAAALPLEPPLSLKTALSSVLSLPLLCCHCSALCLYCCCIHGRDNNLHKQIESTFIYQNTLATRADCLLCLCWVGLLLQATATARALLCSDMEY